MHIIANNSSMFTTLNFIKMRKVYWLLLLAMLAPAHLFAWGIWGHNYINKGAVLALPPEMGLFFYNHVDYIVEESTVPDLRKYTLADKSEGPRHYIDLEYYGYPAKQPPYAWPDVTAAYSTDSLSRYGILPWHIHDLMVKLTAAFKKGHKSEILFIAADLGHYVADAHMPLHTTLNHDGQQTGQRGIHAFWEAQLPELFGRTYKLHTDKATYVPDVDLFVWSILDTSYQLHFSLLSTEKKLRNDNPEEKQYWMGPDGQPVKSIFGSSVHKYEYAHIYHELLGGMVESQMRNAIKATADLWYTAWVNAGKPDLSGMDLQSVSEQNYTIYKEDRKAWQQGKIRGLKPEREFPLEKAQ